MAEKQKRPFLTSLSKPWLAFLLLVIIYLGVNLVKSYYRTKGLVARKKIIQEEILQQQKINQENKEKMVKLEDQEELEKMSREKLGLVKEGEVVYKIVKKEK